MSVDTYLKENLHSSAPSYELRYSKSSFAFQKVQTIALINNNVSSEYSILFCLSVIIFYTYFLLIVKKKLLEIVGPFVRFVWLFSLLKSIVLSLNALMSDLYFVSMTEYFPCVLWCFIFYALY